MRNKFKLAIGLLIFGAIVFFVWRHNLSAQEKERSVVQGIIGAQEGPAASSSEIAEAISASGGNITVDFRNADIQTVLRVLSLKSGVNIVAADNVRGSVTIRLVNVPWDVALETILTTYDYAYERMGNVISVSRVQDLTEQKVKLQKLFETQPVVIEVFKLKFLNAGDVVKVVKDLLSPRGKVAVLYRRGQRGWAFTSTQQTGGAATTAGTTMATTYTPAEFGAMGQEERVISKTFVVIDIPSYVDKIRRTIEVMDTLPKQVFIETRIVEVRRSKLRDIGFDFSTGTVSTFKLNPYKHGKEVGATSYGDNNTPAPFTPVSDGIKGTADATTKLFNTGLNLVYKKLSGFQFEVIMHALEEDVNANVLSAPKLRTLDNQEASILIGTKYPILTSSSSTAGATATATASLDYYQDVGVQLKVVPQVNADGYINMIVHPTVSKITGYVSAGIVSAPVGGGTPVAIQYPILQAREAETQILLKTGETVVIGGLLEDAKAKGREGIPFLKDVPLLGFFFSRDTNDTEKIDLLIFITAYILDEDSNEVLVGKDKLRYEAIKQSEEVFNTEAQKAIRRKN